MSLIDGSLMGAMQDFMSDGSVVGVLLIDEQDARNRVHPETGFQRQVLVFAQRMGCPIWVVELNPSVARGPLRPNLPTRAGLRAVLPPNVPVVTKPHLNAFSGTNLHGLMQTANVRGVVTMGYHSNCCVRSSSVGAYRGRGRNHFQSGMTQAGYMVMSSNLVLRGGQPTWWNERGVKIYSQM